MRSISFGIGIILLIGLLILRCDIPQTKNNVVGVYANTNYRNEPCCVESPHKADTLKLNSNETFTSAYYGNGSYKVSYGILTIEINWTYDYEFGKAGHSAYFSNKIS